MSRLSNNGLYLFGMIRTFDQTMVVFHLQSFALTGLCYKELFSLIGTTIAVFETARALHIRFQVWLLKPLGQIVMFSLYFVCWDSKITSTIRIERIAFRLTVWRSWWEDGYTIPIEPNELSGQISPIFYLLGKARMYFLRDSNSWPFVNKTNALTDWAKEAGCLPMEDQIICCKVWTCASEETGA